jgi:ABC-2 type transport system permease protein
VTVPTAAGEPGGSIYDLGYQRYDGARLGRWAAVRALFWHTVRSCYGIGRGGKAKIVPFLLAALALLPAIIAIGIAALAAQAGPIGSAIEDANPIQYGNYHSGIATLVLLFCAAQAPELLGRDQRYGVLPVYFARALARLDYATAKLLGLMASLLVLVILPYLLLFVGRVLVAPDPLTGIGREAPSLPPAIAQGLLTAGLLGGLSMAISAYTPRRAFATAGIIALFIIPPIVVALISQLASGRLAEWLVLLSPTDVLDGTNAALFDVFPESAAVLSGDLPDVAFLGAAALGTVVAVGLTLRRYLRMSL